MDSYRLSHHRDRGRSHHRDRRRAHGLTTGTVRSHHRDRKSHHRDRPITFQITDITDAAPRHNAQGGKP